jgi:hypothetical protein
MVYLRRAANLRTKALSSYWSLQIDHGLASGLRKSRSGAGIWSIGRTRLTIRRKPTDRFESGERFLAPSATYVVFSKATTINTVCYCHS